MAKKRERIVIDKIFTEDDTDLYRVVQEKRPNEPSDLCLNCTGYFTDEDELESWLEENKDEIKIVRDYRKI